MSNHRGRRSQTNLSNEVEPKVEIRTPSLLVGANLLDHGLDTTEEIYVWANIHSSQDINHKLSIGFQFVKMDDVKARLVELGRPLYFYKEDTSGNVSYGVDLVLMRGSRQLQAQRIRQALSGQEDLMADAGVSEFRHQVDDLLSTKPVKKGQRVAVSYDEDHGEVKSFDLNQ